MKIGRITFNPFLSGMKVLQFSFGGDVARNPYIPYNVPRHLVLYSGTHNNNSPRANTAIVTMQDVLNLGGDDRMNNPAVNKGNWRWKMKPGLLNDDHARSLADMAVIYGRVR